MACMTSASPIGLSRYINFDVLYARQGTVSKLKHKVLDFHPIYLPNSISGQVGMFLQAFAFLFEIYWLVWKILLNLYSSGCGVWTTNLWHVWPLLYPSSYLHNLSIFILMCCRQGTVSKSKHKALTFCFNIFTKLNLLSSWNISTKLLLSYLRSND